MLFPKEFSASLLLYNCTYQVLLQYCMCVVAMFIPLQNLLRSYEIQRRQCPLSCLTKCIVNNELNTRTEQEKNHPAFYVCVWKIRQFPNGFTVVDVISLLETRREKGFQNLFFCLRAVCVCVSCYHRKWRCSRGRCRRATFTFLKQPQAVNIMIRRN